MSRRGSSRLPRTAAAATAAPEVVDLVSSSESDDENMDRKPAAHKKNKGLNAATNLRQETTESVDVLSILSDSDDKEDFVGAKSNNTNGSPAKAVGRGRTSPSSDAELARWFQEQEDDNWKRDRSRERRDAFFAASLQTEEEQAKNKRKSFERRDASFAATLQTEEEQEKNKRKQKEIDDMKKSKAGRSVLLVDKVIQIVEQLQQGPSKTETPAKTPGEDISPVGKDDAVYLAEKMLELQETFHQQGVSTHVCLGYHYTNSANLDCIRTDGLLTIEDRTKTNNKNTKAVAHFGNGLYTATNQYAFHPYGDVGLLVAILRGKEQHIGKEQNPALESGTNTVIGNKTGKLGNDEIILKQSSQVLPLVRFNKKVTYEKKFYDLIWQLHEQIQHEVLDEYFNGSTRTAVERTSCLTTQYTRPPAAPPVASARAIASTSNLATTAKAVASASLPLQATPSHVSQTRRRTKRAKHSSTGASSRQQMTTTPMHETVVYNVPNTLVAPSDIMLQPVVGSGGSCSICICPLVSADRDIVKLPNCNDEFHEACIKSALKHSVKCPNCKAPATEKLQGSSPAGMMTILSSPSVDVSGFAGAGSISITYAMKGGTQRAFHQNPGVRYSGTTRVAYLPNNAHGRALLTRLKYAFQHGVMFTIGTSLTTHQPNMIVWAGIHVKTSAHGGSQAHGSPDPNYFQNANGELDGLGVPTAPQIMPL